MRRNADYGFRFGLLIILWFGIRTAHTDCKHDQVVFAGRVLCKLGVGENERSIFRLITYPLLH